MAAIGLVGASFNGPIIFLPTPVNTPYSAVKLFDLQPYGGYGLGGSAGRFDDGGRALSGL